MTTGEQPGAGRRTITVRHIAGGAAGSVCRQGIDVWRRNIWAAVETYIPITKIIRKNDNDVRMILCTCDVTQGQPAEQGEQECNGAAPDLYGTVLRWSFRSAHSP